MAYEKHDWQTGEVITEELLDHMEEGIEEGVAGNVTVFDVVEDETNNLEILATWQNIFDAISSGPVFLKCVLSENEIAIYYVTNVRPASLPDVGYAVSCIAYGGAEVYGLNFIAETTDSHPVVSD